MRWFWIDKFEQFEPGKRAVAVKCVSLAEEHLHDHFPLYPVMPNALILEGMAQTGGILVGQMRNFEEKVVLAKVTKAVFHRHIRPGDRIRHEAVIENISEAGAAIAGTVTCDGEKVAEIALMFSHVDQNMAGMEFPEENFVFHEGFRLLLDSLKVSG
ncbi:MAG: beta-hydroxyacyl-ACP dehydratase [Phycisphaerae bacterium]|nr:beta-hydroxyacyl-ACP dehydratase [Phycisphaerae bacterium]